MSTAATGTTPTAPEVCPYCGGSSFIGSRCQQCRGLSDPLSLQASQNDMGPWYIRADNSPFRPGCSYRMLVLQVMKGRVNVDSVLRGPTTRQFWMKASRTPGISHLLGICHSCGERVDPASESCPACRASFVIDAQRQHLGLGPVYLVPGQATSDDVVVAGKRLPPLVADSVDFEPLFLDDSLPERPLPRISVEDNPEIDSEVQLPRRSHGLTVALLIWAILASVAAGLAIADSWLDLGIGISRQTQTK